MKTCFAVLHYSAQLVSDDPARYLTRVPLYRELPLRLAARGHHVEVVHAYPTNLHYTEGGVRYHFVASGTLARGVGRLGAYLLGRDPSELEAAVLAVRRVVALEPEIVHFHGTTLHLNLALLAHHLPHETPIVIHHHGGGLARRALTRRLQVHNLRRASRLLISARSHAVPFVDGGAFRDEDVVELMEMSSSFAWRARDEARRETDMQGDPVLLSAGRLHPVKDPITMLTGFEIIAQQWPQARLYMVYVSEELAAEVRAWISGRPALAGRIEMRGRVEPAAMEAVMNSADFLLQASRREWSGLAVLEAMACGTIPVVSDIPAFRAMTEGEAGLLFPVGDAEALARRVLEIGREGIEARSRQLRSLFEERWSYARLAERLEGVYRDVLIRSTRPSRPTRNCR